MIELSEVYQHAIFTVDFFLCFFSFEEYYDQKGKKGIKMRFYLKGTRRRATVYLEKREVSIDLISL